MPINRTVLAKRRKDIESNIIMYLDTLSLLIPHVFTSLNIVGVEHIRIHKQSNKEWLAFDVKLETTTILPYGRLPFTANVLSSLLRLDSIPTRLVNHNVYLYDNCYMSESVAKKILATDLFTELYS